MDSQPLVSIIIPTYNRQHFVTDAIDSCLAQTWPNCEIIVVDDGSTDGSADFLRQRYGSRICLIRQDNQGPGIARNSGIAAARGAFIHFLDADDQLHKRKIEIGLQAFQQHSDVAVVYTHFQFVASDGRRAIETPPFEQFSAEPFCELLRHAGCRILLSSSMYRAAALRAVGGFAADVHFRSAEDWDLLLRLAARYKFYGINQPLVYRRMHDSMLSDDRYYGVWGRLKTIENARQYGWQRCMSAAEFDSLEAARHHVFAFYLWRAGQRRQARQHFRRAVAIHPPAARARRLYALYTYFLPPAAVDWTLASWRRLRAIMHRFARNSV